MVFSGCTAHPVSKISLKSHIQTWNSGLHWSPPVGVTGSFCQSGEVCVKSSSVEDRQNKKISSEIAIMQKEGLKISHTLNIPIHLWEEFKIDLLSDPYFLYRGAWLLGAQGVCTQSLSLSHIPSALSLVVMRPWLLGQLPGCPQAWLCLNPSLSQQYHRTGWAIRDHITRWHVKTSCLKTGVTLEVLGIEVSGWKGAERTHLGSLVTHAAWLGPGTDQKWAYLYF